MSENEIREFGKLNIIETTSGECGECFKKTCNLVRCVHYNRLGFHYFCPNCLLDKTKYYGYTPVDTYKPKSKEPKMKELSGDNKSSLLTSLLASLTICFCISVFASCEKHHQNEKTKREVKNETTNQNDSHPIQ